MSEIRWIQAEIKWAQIESAISRAGGWVGHTLTHRYVSIHQQHCGTPAICCVGCAACQKRRRYYCMAGASTRSQQREEVQLCICVYTAFPPRNSDARVSGVCSHMLVHPISPFGPNAMSAENRLRTDCRIEKAVDAHTTGIRGGLAVLQSLLDSSEAKV